MGDTSDSKLGAKDPLFIASRSQANFIENVPLAIIVSLLAELNGANRYGTQPNLPSTTPPPPPNVHTLTLNSKYINYGLGALLAFRIAHVEMGMLRPETKGPGRAVGFFGTQAFIAGFAGYIVYLVKDYWMS